MADRTVSVRLKADIDQYIRSVATATASTKALRQEAERFDGRTYAARVNVRDTDRAAKQVRDVRRELRGLHMDARALKIPAIGAGLAAGAPAAASLVGSVRQLGGALALLPAAALAAGTGVAVLAAGMSGFADAVKDGGEALDKLAPSARAAAAELRSQAAAWGQVRDGVQQALFAGQAERLDRLGQVYLPVVGRAASGLATELGRAAGAFADFAARADTVRDARDGIELTRQAFERLAPVGVNLSTIFRDLAAVGSRELPAMAAGLEAMTARWSRAVADARASGDLARWMAEGRAEAAQLGRILVDTGGILAGIGRAAEGAGIDTVASFERMTDAAHRWIDTAEGQARIRGILSAIRSDVDAFLPGLRDLAGAAAGFVANLSGSGTLRQAGEAFSALVESARPTAEVLGQLTTAVLKPLLATVQALAPALGPLAAGMLALKGASAVVGGLQTRLDGLGGRFDRAARAASGSADATSRVGGAVRGLGRALPGIGLALVATAGAYELLRSRADDAASAVLNGQMDLGAAAQATFESLARQRSALDPVVALTMLFGTEQEKAAIITDTANDAIRQNSAAIEAQIAKMTPLQAANARVTLAQQGLNDAVRAFGAGTPQATAAANQLAAANEYLETRSIAASLGVDMTTAAAVRSRNEFLGARDAEVAYAAAKDAATLSAQQNGRTLDINTAQGRANRTALDEMAAAAYRDIEAKRSQGASTDDIARRTDHHRGELVRAAEQLGLTTEEANVYVQQLGQVPGSVNTNFTTSGIDDALAKIGQLATEINGVYIGPGALPGPGERPGERAGNNYYSRGRRGYATGGPIVGPGTGTSDSIIARVSDGEWVIRERAARQQGDAAMALLNAGRADVVPRYATGYASGGKIAGGPGYGIPRNVNIDFTGVANRIARDIGMFAMPAGGGGAGVEQWRGLALQALAMMGQSAVHVNRMLRQIRTESGGNPRAINLWDSNARKGTPSMGLLQTIMPTYRSYADPRRNLGPFDPLSNMLASIRYSLARYGSLPRAWRGVGYHDGGVVPGAGEGYAFVKGGERVLTTGQTVSFDRFVEAIDRPTPVSAIPGVRGGDGGSAPVINQHQEITLRETLDIDLFNQRQAFALRAVTF